MHLTGYHLNVAAELALERHGDQKYGNEPYVYHLDQVVQNLTYMGNSYDIETKHLIVGMLHDIIEDTDTSHYELEQMFGNEVADAVQVLTKPESMSNDEYLRRISLNRVALFVKIADAISNAHHSMMDGGMVRAKYYMRKVEKLREYGGLL